MNPRHRYAKAQIPGWKDYTMLAVTGLVCGELGIEVPDLGYMRPCEAGEKACHEDELYVRGVALPRERKVLLRTDLRWSVNMIETLAHELRHLWQVEKGYAPGHARAGDLESYRNSPCERDAVAYGEWWARRIDIPPGAELASGFESPDDLSGERIKSGLPYGTDLYYVNLEDEAVYFWSDVRGRGWRLNRTAKLRGERTPAFNY